MNRLLFRSLSRQTRSGHCHHSSATWRKPVGTGLILGAAMIQLGMLTGISQCKANPSNRDPKAAIKSLGANPHAQGKITQLYDFYNAAESEAIKYIEQKNPSRLPFTKITKTYAQIWKAHRDAEHLQLMGEAAGNDLGNKFRMLRHEYRQFSLHAAPMRPRVVAKLRKESPRHQRTLQQATKLAQAGNFTQAATMLEKLGMTLQADLFYLTNAEANPFWDPFLQVLNPVDEKVKAQRKAKYKSATMQVAAAKREATEKLKVEGTRLASEIASTGSASLGGDQTGDAAAAIDYLGTLWGASSAELINHWAMACAFENESTQSPGSAIKSELADIESIAMLGIGSIIEAGAKSAKTDQVAELYSRVLKAVSKMDRRMVGNASTKCERSLAKLASKNPALPQQIQRYERAIAEAVRWRSDFTWQQEQRLLKDYPDAGARLSRKEVIEHDKRPKLYQKAPMARERIVAPASFGPPAQWMVYDAEQLVGQRVSDSDILGILKKSSLCVARHQEGHYCQFKVPVSMDQHIADLHEALLLDPSHGPLTIEAADAISAAEHLDFKKMGAQIIGIHLESLTSRFAQLPAMAHVIVPLNDVPKLDSNIAPVEQTCWRLDLQPHWLRHSLFTIEVETE